nr:CD3324 family protein [Metabacillus sp. cB07]
MAEMKYVNANEVLPDRLITEIQQYIQGESIYIPRPESSRQKWGSCSGSRKWIDERNDSIRTSFRSGSTIQELANEYFLSTETIKKIVYKRKPAADDQ